MAAYGALANIGSRAAGMLLMVLTVHWATPYLGVERFGVWATFASLAAMLSFLDLGVGNALVSRVAHAAADNDRIQLRRVVTGGIGWLVILGICAAALLVSAAFIIPWGALFKLSDTRLEDEACRAAAMFGGLFGLHLLSSGLLKILVGQQRSYEAHSITALGAIAACVALWFATESAANLATLLFAGFGVQSLAGLVAGLLLWKRGHFNIPDLYANTRSERGSLLKAGSMFLALQIGTMIGWGSDSLLLAGFAGAGHVAVYAIAQRLFMFASQPVMMLNGPLWAAYADALALGDHRFIRQTLRRSMMWSIGGGGALSLAVALTGPWIVPHWTQGALEVPLTLFALFFIWTTIEVGGIAFATYLNGAGIVREQVFVVLAFCVVALPLKVLAVMSFGASGLLMVTIFAWLLTHVGLYSTVYRRRVLLPIQLAETKFEASNVSAQRTI